MTFNAAYIALLIAGLCFMLLQIFVKQKRLEHIFFAIFCGSMAMLAAQQLSAESFGPYQYLLGLGACVTCNGMWLISKAIFSGEKSIQKKHLIFATLIALLVIINNFLHMAHGFAVIKEHNYQLVSTALGEIINLFSSTVLVLSCWEALNGITKQTKKEYWIRVLFISVFCIGFLLCTVVYKTFVSKEMQPTMFPWFVCISAIQIMIATQFILWFKQTKTLKKHSELINNKSVINEVSEIDSSLISGIDAFLKDEKKYLTHNLKMIDLANELKVSEYKISRAIRHHFAAPNFNHYVNSLRIEHAKNLLEQEESQHWSILVISMESGFSSLATFNRVFKTQMGYSPNEHRKKRLYTI